VGEECQDIARLNVGLLCFNQKIIQQSLESKKLRLEGLQIGKSKARKHFGKIKNEEQYE
jgi:hypothetical protein